MQNDLFREAGQARVSSPDQLSRYIKIVTPGAAVMILGMAAVLIGALVWGFFGSVPVTANLTGAVVLSQDGESPRILCVVPMQDEAGTLEPGMQAQISLSTAPREDYGYLYGTVESVSAYPVTRDRLAARVGNAELADYLMGEDVGKLVVIAPEADGASPNGLKWSHRNGKNAALVNGALCDVLLLVREQRPIDLVLDGAGA